MNKRNVVRTVFEGKQPPYVPWAFSFTQEAAEKLALHYATRDLEPIFQNHMASIGSTYGFFTDLGNDQYSDIFGVVWDRSIDKDIGNVHGQVLPEPSLKGYQFPDPNDPLVFSQADETMRKYPDRFRTFDVSFSLYERAWTLRGMVELMMDFLDNPRFVHELLNTIADYNIALIERAVKYDIDAVHFGDDWGQQHGLLMGYRTWKEFIYPVLKRMYAAVHAGGKYVTIHSCGDVDELFEDLIEAGVNCFNPFQPEVMDVYTLVPQYRGRLAFHGGMSTQRTLPYGSVDEVRRETRRLIELGRSGGFIFAPAHSVEGDVPLENLLAFIETIQAQDGVEVDSA